MGWVRSLVFVVAAGLISLSAAAAHASSAKGVNAFQRGKYEDALRFFGPAAEEGDPEALYYLGRMYYAGQGVPKDLNKATGLFQKAAEGGSPGAQQSLGSALMLGEGVDQDMVEALKWFIVAARAGNKDAAAYAGRVARFMTREQRLEARKRALAWQKAHEEKNPDSQ